MLIAKALASTGLPHLHPASSAAISAEQPVLSPSAEVKLSTISSIHHRQRYLASSAAFGVLRGHTVSKSLFIPSTGSSLSSHTSSLLGPSRYFLARPA